VIYFESRLFTLAIFLRKRAIISKGNFEIKISNVKTGVRTYTSVEHLS